MISTILNAYAAVLEQVEILLEDVADVLERKGL